MYALVDCNSFYASCEQIFRPDIRGKPVVVLSNNDGCIVARSKEAKDLQIPDLQAYFKLKPFLDRHGVHVFSSNYELYADISSRVVDVMNEYAPEMEVYSIDESFLLLDGLNENYYDYGQNIKNKIWRDVRMPVCVGVAETKTLSKLANHIAKKSKKLNGVCVIDDIDQWDGVFKKLRVSKIWGVGRRLTARLEAEGVCSVYDLKQADHNIIKKNYNINLARTVCELNGERCLALETQPPAKQQIYSTRSFGQKVYGLEGLHQAVSQHATTAMEKLRKQNSLVGTVQAFIETSRFSSTPIHRSHVIKLPIPTNDTSAVIGAVKKIVESIYVPNMPYAKAGVGLIEIISEENLQFNLFNHSQMARSESLMKVLDGINHSGVGHVSFASSGIDQFWKMQRKFKSPSYTTRLNELVSVSV